MRVLVTGASGFVGPQLVKELLSHKHDIVLTAHMPYNLVIDGKPLQAIPCDLSNDVRLSVIVKQADPDAVIHLAAISHTVKAQDARGPLVATNVIGTHNVCRAVADLKKPVAFLYVSSSMVYGVSDHDIAFSETSLPRATTPYGCSKLAGEYVTRSYASETFKPYIVRPFNHIGPGQSPEFVCAALAKRIADTPNGGTIDVGNLSAKRDFSDVRDIVRAYRLILEKMPQEDLFVLGSGIGITIQEVFDFFIKISGKTIYAKINKNLLRANDPPSVTAAPELAARILGWRPSISFYDTLRDIYESFVKN